jgi:hypothetical protein
MADQNPMAAISAGAGFVQQLRETQRKNAAYNALSKIYGDVAGDPQLAIESAKAQTAMHNAPLDQAAAKAKADALQQSVQQYGPSAGDPEAEQQNQANQETAGQNQRQAQFRGIQSLKSAIPPGTDAVPADVFDRVVGANAKTLGLNDPDQLARFKARVTAPGGAAHLDEIGQALLAPQTAVGAPIVAQGPNGSMLLSRTKNGQIVQQQLGEGVVPVQQQRANQGQQNANTNSAKLPIMQQNANTAAYSANTRSNNSQFGNPQGAAGSGGAGKASPNAAANTHVGNEDGTATTPTFERLAPVGSRARASAIGTATQIVNQDTQLQSTNKIIDQTLSQITPYTAGTGALLSHLPASASGNLRANLSNLKASGQMAWIASLKNQSGQTGIGRVLQSEAKNAETLFGNMEQDQNAKQLDMHVRMFRSTLNRLHSLSSQAFKAQWGQDPYALLGASPGKGGTGGQAPIMSPELSAAYKKYGLPH